MAANYWESSQKNHWQIDRLTLAQSREEDIKYVSSEGDYIKLKIWFCKLMQDIAKRFHLKQQVVATSFVYFKRFYIKNSLRLTDPLLVLVTCVYLASKIEECPVHIKMITQEAKVAFQDFYGGFPYDSSKVAEFEFYLLEELEFYLIVWHPYRTLSSICQELGMREQGLQFAWFIINDAYRTDIPLLYPPHLVALAALYLTIVLNHADFAPGSIGDRTDMKQWFSDLNVEIETIVEITQEILSIYEIWADWKEERMMAIWKEFKTKPLIT